MRRHLWIAVLFLGAGLAAAAILANWIGLDRNAVWGMRRILLLAVGALLVILGFVFQPGQRLIMHMRESRVLHWLWAYRLGLLASFSVLFALAVYIFFLSAGKWTKWPETTHYYDDLGAAFRAGRLDLNIQPSAQLLAVTDPYEPSLRNSDPAVKAFVDTVWDLTFYNGKFYVYWGPAPGVLLALVKVFYQAVISDQYLVFAFLAGLLVFTTLLILRLRRAFYQDVPVGLTVIGILVAALMCPIPWMLNRAAIYEATISAGQFFLVGGLYFAYTGLEHQPVSYGRLVLAVVFWTLAASSRTLILIPAAFLTFMMILWVATDGGRRRPLVGELPGQLALALPLVLGTLAVGWYNWARFGSVFETGLRYTLTFENLDQNYSQSFSAFYALPSLWMFLFNLFQVGPQFPFLVAVFGRSPAFLYLNDPGLYHAEELTGLLFCAPFVLFSFVAMRSAVGQVWGTYIRRGGSAEERDRQLQLWITLCLMGAGLLTFAAIILYFNVTMRFLAEFLPSLMVLAVLGVWQAYRALREKPVRRTVFVSLVVVIALATITVSLLLAFSEAHGTVQQYNHRLMMLLVRFFSG